MKKLIERIRDEHLNARKKRLAVHASILTVLRGEAEKVGKDKGNRDPSDDEVIQVVRKLIKSGNEMKELVKDNEEQLVITEVELDVLESFLPAQLSDDDIIEAAKTIVDEVGATTMKQMGQVMGLLRKKFGNSLNMAVASKTVKELLGS